MDVEYYLRNLLGTTASPDARRAIYKSPRRIDPEIAADLLDIVTKEVSVGANVPVAVVQANATAMLPLFLPFFRQYAPLREENLSDQYYFDVCVYMRYLIAEARIPESMDRLRLRDRVGDAVLALLQRKRGLRLPGRTRDLPATADAMRDTLQCLQRAGVIESFAFDDEDMRDREYAASLFVDGLPLSVQVTVDQPATLLGTVQMAASNTRLHPDIVGAAVLRCVSACGFSSQFEDYLMDNFYREENEDVQAQSILLELLITPSP